MRITSISLYFIFFPIFATAQIVTTIAGTGDPGYSGDGGLAINAKFNHPDRMIFDTSGNMYIADEHNHVVRKISKSGIVTTIAGTGYGAGTLTGGYSGDNGPATNAELSRPSDLIFDKFGNLYVTEFGNGTIRKITPSGIITTIAGTGSSGSLGDGGPATAAQLYDPFGLVFDSSGNLFFSCNGTARVRKINSAGIIETIAGNGISGFGGDGGPATSAQVSLIGYNCLSPSGDLLIADYGANHRIRKINSSGIISTFIGNGVASNTGDGGPATAATIAGMFGVIYDSSGNLYLSGTSKGIIRKVNTSGTITTIAGTGTVGYSGDGGNPLLAQFNTDVLVTAFDAAGNIYIADPVNNRIRKITFYTKENEIRVTRPSCFLYPNPAKDEITLQIDCKFSTIELMDLGGKIVPVEKARNGNKATLHISNLPGGYYTITIDGECVGKFIKD